MRLFVAVGLSRAAAEAVAGLARPALAGVRWTTPAQWHVTLRFLGEVADGAVPEVVEELQAAALPAATAVLGPATACFGPSVLHVPVEGLAALAAAVDPAPQRPFAGHVTLARSRRGGPDLRRLAGAPVGGRRRGRWRRCCSCAATSAPAGRATRCSTASRRFPADHHPTNTRSQLRWCELLSHPLRRVTADHEFDQEGMHRGA